MVLCSFCENITIDGIAVDYGPSLQRWEEPPGYNHAPDYPALLESAKTCELCRLIRDCGQDEGIIPEFDPKFDMVPDQITRRNASQRLNSVSSANSRIYPSPRPLPHNLYRLPNHRILPILATSYISITLSSRSIKQC